MKTIIVYSSKTGFTEKYAKWLSEKLEDAKLFTLNEAKKLPKEAFEEADAVIYGGWVMASKVVGAEWFAEKAESWKGKKLALYATGGSPEDNPDIELWLKGAIPEDKREYVRTFYCPGGFCYEKMKLPARLAMKAFSSALRNKKDQTEQEKIMGEMISKDYDITDEKYADAIVKYIKGLQE